MTLLRPSPVFGRCMFSGGEGNEDVAVFSLSRMFHRYLRPSSSLFVAVGVP